MSEKCGAIGALTVGGRVVGQLRCERPLGHEWGEQTPHAVTMTWTPEAEPDLDLFDPAESFDIDVPIEGTGVGSLCLTCGGVLVDIGPSALVGPYFVHRDSTPTTRSHFARVD